MIAMRSGILVSWGLIAAAGLAAQGPPRAPLPAIDAGRKAFETRCGVCHGGDGNGGEMGPPIRQRLAARSDPQLTALIHSGIPASGMPPTPVEGPELASLVRYLRSIQTRRGAIPLEHRSVETTAGVKLDGVVLGEGFEDLQLRTADNRVHLLRRAGEKFREVTSDSDWPTYNGDPRGNRYTTLTQIDKASVSQLAPRWIYAFPATGFNASPPTRLQGTPVVVEGLMYITDVNQCIALDAGTGREVWRFFRRKTPKLFADPGSNRGVAVAGDKVFLETDNAHIVAINRFTGNQVWDSEVADTAQNYFSTGAPLTAGDLVVAGVSGGEHGANGQVAAFDQATGKEMWRFHVIPKRGEPGSETWQGKEIDHGGGPTWFTGSYDPDLDTVYWPTGNPSEEYNGDARPGDNLYTDCILALDRKTGKLKWHYQFTPHDLWDWDSTETSILVDAVWQGQVRKLMLHADRNGFFYVFDRTDGKLLLAKQFLKHVTWASGIGADGRPIKLPNQEPTEKGTHVCPSQDGATNWYSPSFNPLTGMYYFQTNERCSIYTKRDQPEWVAGKTYLGGSESSSNDPKPQRVLKAVDYQTGETKWELVQPGPDFSWGGTLSTATGLVFFEEETGSFAAADATTGKVLWSFQANAPNWHASPMAYSFDGKEHIAVVVGGSIISMALPE
jgi:alcohol dehydrogenase (cytochrome c)